MSNNQVIELRQLGTDTIQYTDDEGKIKNGDFKTRLKKPITLNQGDTLRLNQIFLQTEELEDDQIKIESPITLRVAFYRYIRDVINQIQPRYDELTNLTGAGQAIPIDKTPSMIVQQQGLSVYGAGSIPAGLPNAGNFCSFTRTGEVMVETLSLNSGGVSTGNIFQIKSITFKKIDTTKSSITTNVLLEYKNALDQLSLITERLPVLTDTNTITLTLNLCGKDLGTGSYIRIINGNILQQSNIEFDSVDIGFQLGTVPTLLTPVSKYRDITIPSGIYHATELATVITDKLNDTDLDGVPFNDTPDMLRNSFLGLADNTAGIGQDASGFPNQNQFGTSNNLKVFVSQDGLKFNMYGTFKKQVFGGATTVEAIPNRPNILCGTDSFSLEYDESLSKFKITKIHYSINDLDGKTSNQIIDNPNPQKLYEGGGSFQGLMFNRVGQPDQASHLASAFGGIIITALAAFDEQNNFINFWEDTLGFDTNSLTARISQPFTTNVLAETIAIKNAQTESQNTNLGHVYKSVQEPLSTFTYSVENGVNITTDQATISGLHNADTITLNTTTGQIESQSGREGHFYFNSLNPINDGGTTIQYNQFINTTLTKQVFARDIFESKNLNFAYYLVEINALVDNDFISSNDIKNKIFSVINRYYQLGGYLSGTNSGIQYTHEGESIMISELSVRILQADGSIADNLKSDNTVFLELLRG